MLRGWHLCIVTLASVVLQIFLKMNSPQTSDFCVPEMVSPAQTEFNIPLESLLVLHRIPHNFCAGQPHLPGNLGTQPARAMEPRSGRPVWRLMMIPHDNRRLSGCSPGEGLGTWSGLRTGAWSDLLKMKVLEIILYVTTELNHMCSLVKGELRERTCSSAWLIVWLARFTILLASWKSL